MNEPLNGVKNAKIVADAMAEWLKTPHGEECMAKSLQADVGGEIFHVFNAIDAVVGDLVILKSGSPLMTVHEIFTEDTRFVSVCWFKDNKEVGSGFFNRDCLFLLRSCQNG